LLLAISLSCEGHIGNTRRTDGKQRSLDFAVKDDPVNANALVDEILDIVNVELEALGLDPYYADLDILDLFRIQGNLSGLATLARFGDAEMDTDGFDITISCDVSVTNVDGELAIVSDWISELGASANVDVANIIVDLELKVTLPLGPFKLVNFATSDIGDITVKVKGLGPLFDPVIDDVTDLIANAVKDLVADLLDSVVKDILNIILENL